MEVGHVCAGRLSGCICNDQCIYVKATIMKEIKLWLWLLRWL